MEHHIRQDSTETVGSKPGVRTTGQARHVLEPVMGGRDRLLSAHRLRLLIYSQQPPDDGRRLGHILYYIKPSSSHIRLSGEPNARPSLRLR